MWEGGEIPIDTRKDMSYSNLLFTIFAFSFKSAIKNIHTSVEVTRDDLRHKKE